MVVLEFKNHHVLKMEYERNSNFDAKKEAGFNPNINVSYHTNSNKEANGILRFSSKEELPFNVEVQIGGIFNTMLKRRGKVRISKFA